MNSLLGALEETITILQSHIAAAIDRGNFTLADELKNMLKTVESHWRKAHKLHLR